MSKIAIATTPQLLRRISDDPETMCPVCLAHERLLIVKTTKGYYLHTEVNGDTRKYIHHWTHRSKDPTCLEGMTVVKKIKYSLGG